MKKFLSSVLAITMGCGMALSCTACDFLKKEEEPKNQHMVTLTVEESPTSLVAYAIESYLNGPIDTLVSSYLYHGTERLDKGAPVVIDYQIESSAVVDVLKIEAEFSLYEDFSVIEQKQSFNDTMEKEINVYNLKAGERYYVVGR